MSKPQEDLTGVLRQMQELQSKYSTLSMEAMFRAYDRAIINNPWIQNRRGKAGNTLPLNMARTPLPRLLNIPAAMSRCSGAHTMPWRPPPTLC